MRRGWRPHPQWRWLRGREDSPWYPTMRLFRQKRDRDWAPVFQRMADRLAAMVAGHGLPAPAPSALAGAAPLGAGAVPLCPAAGGTAVVTVPMSPGDLVDRITVLQVKADRLAYPAKWAHVMRELALLRQARDAAALDWLLAAGEEAQLSQVHAELWDLENTLRVCERHGDFGAAFVQAARTIMANNARRASLKRAVNDALGRCWSRRRRTGRPGSLDALLWAGPEQPNPLLRGGCISQNLTYGIYSTCRREDLCFGWCR